jgi:hypothetical protein
VSTWRARNCLCNSARDEVTRAADKMDKRRMFVSFRSVLTFLRARYVQKARRVIKSSLRRFIICHCIRFFFAACAMLRSTFSLRFLRNYVATPRVEAINFATFHYNSSLGYLIFIATMNRAQDLRTPTEPTRLDYRYLISACRR